MTRLINRRRRTRLVLMLCLAGLVKSAPGADGGYQRVARDAARWIRSAAVQQEKGTAWPADPNDPRSISPNLYSGTAGVVLFFLEAARAPADAAYFRDARAGADYLLAMVEKVESAGLYTGLAGVGFTLQETFKATGDPRYRDGASRCARLIQQRAVRVEDGVHWTDTNDIVAGSAGIGLFLLYAARELKEPAFRETAVQAARRLLRVARPEAGGLKWAMDSKFPRLMPNFSHGTAGVAYFLASVFQETKQRAFLEAALAGGRYLQAVAKTEGDVCLVFHNEPDGEDLYYLSWCHGPVGTARLFFRLYQVTGDRGWMDWVKKCARGVMTSGIPEKQTPGFWNNISQCCGSAGVAEFFLSLHRLTGERRYLEFAKRVTAQLLSRATRDEKGSRWVQAEHRVKPDLLVAQTGYMQGAAGIGILLLRMSRPGARGNVVLPDNPF